MKKILFFFSLFSLIFLISACNIQEGKEEELTEEIEINKNELIAYLIKEARCVEGACQTDLLKNSLLEVFPDLKFVEYDYKNDPQGEKFYNDYQLNLLPALLFTKPVENQENYNNVQPYLVPNKVDADLLSLNIGANFNPQKEICDNNIDDTGNGLVDCTDPECQDSLMCREEISSRLDLFVMSQCPYGTMALDAMEELIDNFGSEIDFNVHYIASENSDGSFKSLHGQPEVDENIRELCAIEYYPEDYQYMDYIWCRNKDINSKNWQTCAQNFPKIKTCFESEEGTNLLKENIKLANDLGISASPTWMVNNRYQFGGITAEVIKQNLCQYNDLGETCSIALSNDSATNASCN